MFTERRSSPPTPGGMGRGDVGGVGGLASVRIRDLLRQCMLADALDALGGTSKVFPPNALAVSLRKLVLVQTCYRCNFATCGHVPLLTCASAQLAY